MSCHITGMQIRVCKSSFTPQNTCTVTHMCITLIFLYILGSLGQTRSQVANIKGWHKPPFFVLDMFYNFNPLFQCPEDMYKCTCVLLIFLFYFRFAWMSTKHINPIHAPTTTTSSSKRAAARKSVPANCTTSPACKSAPANHEPMIKGSFIATHFCFRYDL